MILLHSHASYDFGAKPGRRDFRLRVGTTLLVSVVALLALLNLIAGAA